VALSLAAKETSFITFAIFGSFLGGMWLVQWLNARGRGGAALPVFDLVVVVGTLILPTATAFPVKLLGGDPIDYSQQGILLNGAVFLALAAIGAAVGLWWNWRRWLACAGIFYAIFVPLFTTLFTNGQGFATGMVGQLGYWLSQHGVARGGQPLHYYVVILALYEFLPVLLAAGGTIYYIIRGGFWRRPAAEGGPVPAEPVEQARFPLVALLIYWSIAAFCLYSWAGEKMPWLAMHLVVPLDLLAGWTLGRLLGADWREIRSRGGLWLLAAVPLFVYLVIRLLGGVNLGGTSLDELSDTMAWVLTLLTGLALVAVLVDRLGRLRRADGWRLATLGPIIVLAAATLRFAWMATFTNAAMATEFLVYAQGAPDTAIVTRELEDLSKRLTGGLHMTVAYDDDSSWPFVWYLRNFDQAQFYGKQPAGPFDADVVIVGPANEAAVKPFLGNRYYERHYTLVWWPDQDWYMNMTPASLWNDLRDPVARKALWAVIWARDYGRAIDDWPLVHDFTLYLRRDLAEELWDYAPQAQAAEELPTVDYTANWTQRVASAIWGSAGSSVGQLLAPKGLAADAAGNIYVADSANNRVVVFDANGAFLRQWGSLGSGEGQFSEPWGVAVSAGGEVYVADTWNHRVQVFSADGQFLRQWGQFGEAPVAAVSGDLLYGPRDIAVSAEGDVYVSDTGNKRIVRYDPDGNMLGAVGGIGGGDGQFQEPVGLALADDGTLYVADTWNQRVQVFSADLAYVAQWPVYAWEGFSVTNKPYLAVDEDYIYISDPDAHRVLTFDLEGVYVSAWGQYGADATGLNLPTGVLMDGEGRLLVSDSGNGRILLYEAGQ
jgi:uncharacterized protein (TIGR03663 family)